MTFKAKDKATQDLELIDSMRRSLGAAGLVVVFETWRDYVKTKRQRERRDLEKKYELEVKSFATAMQSVQIAQVRVCVLIVMLWCEAPCSFQGLSLPWLRLQLTA